MRRGTLNESTEVLIIDIIMQNSLSVDRFYTALLATATHATASVDPPQSNPQSPQLTH